VAKRSRQKCRSGCPVSVSLDLLGDRWSLLIIRDLMVRGYRSFHEFESAGEGIATNILADRLHKLGAAGILATEPVAGDGRGVHYRLTPKGIALAPVLLELLIWAAHHEHTAAPCSFIARIERSRETILAETYRRWKERDPTPLIPSFESRAKSQERKGAR